jgi:L-ascorbate metabolism protein UlaG (beta-lactamase superfamily)
MYTLDKLEIKPPALGVHWFEQSAFAVKSADGRIVFVDPYFPSERPKERFLRPQPPVDPASVHPDLVLLTHDHQDHTNPETIAAIAVHSRETVFVGPPESIARICNESAVPEERTRIISAGESLRLFGASVHAVYSKPPEGDPHAGIDVPNTTHLGYVVEIGGRRLYFTGDPINTIADLPTLTEPVRSLEPEIAFITSHPTEGEFPFFEGARRLAERIGATTAVPSHYQCFARRTYDPQDFARAFAGSKVKVTVIPWNEAVVVWQQLRLEN